MECSCQHIGVKQPGAQILRHTLCLTITLEINICRHKAVCSLTGANPITVGTVSHPTVSAANVDSINDTNPFGPPQK
jgi:hypothetical protein